MNRWELLCFGGLLPALLLMTTFIAEPVLVVDASNIRQRSDGCGPHPLIALAAASRPFGSNGVGSLNDVLRAVRSDPVVWPVMQNLLRRYDDCIRAADGLHYKRSDDSGGSIFSDSGAAGGSGSPSSGLVSTITIRGGGQRMSSISRGSTGFSSFDPDAIGSTDIDVLPRLVVAHI